MQLTSYALALVQAAGQPVASHARPVAELAGDVGTELELGEAACQEVQIAALLHDVGKAALMTEILDKPSGLSADEVELVKTHPARAQEMLESAGRHFARSPRSFAPATSAGTAPAIRTGSPARTSHFPPASSSAVTRST